MTITGLSMPVSDGGSTTCSGSRSRPGRSPSRGLYQWTRYRLRGSARHPVDAGQRLGDAGRHGAGRGQLRRRSAGVCLAGGTSPRPGPARPRRPRPGRGRAWWRGRSRPARRRASWPVSPWLPPDQCGRPGRLRPPRRAGRRAAGGWRCAPRSAARDGSGCVRRATGPRRRGRGADSGEPSGQASAWRTPASYTWNQWKPASSCSRRAAEGRDRGRARAAAAQVARDDGARPVDAALDVPHLVELGDVAGLGLGQPRRGDVEEPVEVDAQRRRGARRAAARATAGADSAWWRPLAVVKEWWTVSQSPWSFWTWKRVMRRAAAKATARPSCSAVAPAAAAPRIASTTASGSSSSSAQPSVPTSLNVTPPPCRAAATSSRRRPVDEPDQVDGVLPLRATPRLDRPGTSAPPATVSTVEACRRGRRRPAPPPPCW